MNYLSKSSLIVITATGLLLGGCATKEDVEHAQATADQALGTAQHAQGTADQALSAAQGAQQSVDKLRADMETAPPPQPRHRGQRG